MVTYKPGSGFPDVLVGKESPWNAGDMGDAGLIAGLGRFSAEGKLKPTPVFLLKNPMERGAWWAIVQRVISVVI